MGKLNEQLIVLAEEYMANKEKMQELVEGITPSDFNKRPSYGGWSIAECIDHLVNTDFDYTKQIEKGLGIAKEKNLLSDAPFKFSWLGKKFIGSVEPPVKRKFKAPGKWVPHSDIPMDEVTSKYMDMQDKYIELVNNSAGLNISKVKLPSPATNLIRFTIFEMFNVNAAHSRRHLWQASNVKKDIL